MIFRSLTLALLLFLVVDTAASQPYGVEVSAEPYAELTDVDFAVPDNSPYWGQMKVVRDMAIPIFGTEYDFNDGVFTVLESGYIFVTNDTRSVTLYIFRSDLGPREGLGQTSEFSFKLEGSSPSKILKMQWKNMGLANGSPDEFANFQVWLYESGILEMRFGPMNITEGTLDDDNPVIGLLHMDEAFSTIYDELYLTGDPHSPTLTSSSISPLGGIPSEGTVYRFLPGSASVDRDLAIEPDVIQIVTDRLSLPIPHSAVIFDALGSHVMNVEAGEQHDISRLPAGHYFVRYLDEPLRLRRFVKR